MRLNFSVSINLEGFRISTFFLPGFRKLFGLIISLEGDKKNLSRLFTYMFSLDYVPEFIVKFIVHVVQRNLSKDFREVLVLHNSEGINGNIRLKNLTPGRGTKE